MRCICGVYTYLTANAPFARRHVSLLIYLVPNLQSTLVWSLFLCLYIPFRIHYGTDTVHPLLHLVICTYYPFKLHTDLCYAVSGNTTELLLGYISDPFGECIYILFAQ